VEIKASLSAGFNSGLGLTDIKAAAGKHMETPVDFQDLQASSQESQVIYIVH